MKDIDAIDRLLLGSENAPPQPVLALGGYRDAADQGSSVAALRLSMMAAQGVGRMPDWHEALDWLAKAAVIGSDLARGQLAALSGRSDVASEDDIRYARAAIDPKVLLTPPKVHGLSEAPRIGVIKGLAAPAWCDWIIKSAGPFLEPSLVYDGATGDLQRSSARTAMAADFGFLRRDLVMAAVQERLARITGLRVPFHEVPNVLSYEGGQEFRTHFDFLDPVREAAEIEAVGQRVITCLTYLNDAYEGGETRFPLIGIQYRGRPGDCLLFFNVTPENQPDRRTAHAGLPPASGRKWLLSQMLRNRMQPLV